MDVIATDFSGLKIVRSRRLADARGDFTKLLHGPTFEDAGMPFAVREVYTSTSRRGVIRGLHFQVPPHDHAKLVYCLKGAILDACVDLRRASPSYGQAFTMRLAADEGTGLVVPAGFAHGLQALEDDTIIINATSREFAPASERGLAWDSCGVDWPILPAIVSDKDKAQPALADLEVFFP